MNFPISQSSSNNSNSVQEIDLNEIVKNIYIGDKHSARNKTVLHQLGIKAIVVAGQQLTMPHPEHFQYLHVPVRDSQIEKINYHFEQACIFIQKNIQKGGVLVHCAYGISRSSTLVIAYLMKKLKINYIQTFSYVRRKRPNVRPNRGFEEQLKLWGQTLKDSK